MTQNPKFPSPRNQKNNSRNKIHAKNDFPDFFGFLSAKSHARKSSKIGFPGNQPENSKISQLYKIIRNGRTRPVYDSF